MKKRIITVSAVIALALCLVLALSACAGVFSSTGTRKKGTVATFKLSSFTVTRSGTLNTDTKNTMCLAVKDGECESVALTYQFENPDGLTINAITINGKTFSSTDFRVGSTALKVVLDYVPDAVSGEYTIKTDKIEYKSGAASRLLTNPTNGSVTVNIAPKFNVTFNASSSGATDIDEITFTDTVEFDAEMRTMEKFYGETEMDSLEGNYVYGKPGYGFSGWYTEPSGKGTLFTADTVYDYYDDITLYAHYEMFFTYKKVTSEDEDFEAEIAGDDDAYIIITGTTTTGNKRSILTVTEEYNGAKVKELGERALINIKSSSVVLNDSLVRIDANACQGVSATFTFGPNVVEIQESAFSGCTGLAKQNAFVLPSSLKVIGNNAFENCTWNYNITNKNTLIIPANVEKIGDKAFHNSGFEKIYFEKGCSFTDKTFGTYVFENSSLLTTLCTSVSISESKKIELESEGGLNYIGIGAFKSCTALKLTAESLAEGLKIIAPNAFCADTKQITELTIPNSLESIGTEAFYNSGLNKINFKNDGVNSMLFTIGDYAFGNCAFGNTAGTDSVDLCAPYLSTYGIAPFFGNTNLKIIKLKTDSVPSFMGKESTYRDGGTYTKYYVPKAQLETYKNNWVISITGWISAFDYSASLPICPRDDIITDKTNRQYALTINEEDNTAVLETIFAPATGAEATITIPGTLVSGTKTYTITSIGEYCAHSGVTKVNFETPGNIKEIQAYAFAGCKNLTTIDFKSLTNLETIGEKAFYKTAVTSFISGSDSLTTIGKDAFYLCSNLSTVKLTHGSDIQLNEYAFCYTGVKDVILGKEVKYIETGVFAYCDSLANVYIEGLDNIHHKKTMYIGPFRSSAAGETEGTDAESGNSSLKIYFVNATVKGYFSNDKYYTSKETGEIVHPTVPNTKTLHDEWRNFYSAYKNCFVVDADKVNAKVAD